MSIFVVIIVRRSQRVQPLSVALSFVAAALLIRMLSTQGDEGSAGVQRMRTMTRVITQTEEIAGVVNESGSRK